MEEVVKLIVNNGAAIGCLIYFMFYNSKQLESLRETIESLKEVIKEMKAMLEVMKKSDEIQ